LRRDIEVLVKVLREMYPRLLWDSVYSKFDMSDFFVVDQTSFQLLVRIYQLATTDKDHPKGRPFPLQHLCSGVWKHRHAQYSLLHHAIGAPHSVVSFVTSAQAAGLSGRLQKPVDAGFPASALATDPKVQEHQQRHHPWWSLDLIRVLLQLSERDGLYLPVRWLFKPAIDQCDELLICGLAQMRADVPNALRHDMMAGLLSAFTATSDRAQRQALYGRLWTFSPQLVFTHLIRTCLVVRIAHHTHIQAHPQPLCFCDETD
jgi:hypothetical protein